MVCKNIFLEATRLHPEPLQRILQLFCSASLHCFSSDWKYFYFRRDFCQRSETLTLAQLTLEERHHLLTFVLILSHVERDWDRWRPGGHFVHQWGRQWIEGILFLCENQFYMNMQGGTALSSCSGLCSWAMQDFAPNPKLCNIKFLFLLTFCLWKLYLCVKSKTVKLKFQLFRPLETNCIRKLSWPRVK